MKAIYFSNLAVETSIYRFVYFFFQASHKIQPFFPISVFILFHLEMIILISIYYSDTLKQKLSSKLLTRVDYLHINMEIAENKLVAMVYDKRNSIQF